MENLHLIGVGIGLGLIVIGAGLGIGRFAAAAAEGGPWAFSEALMLGDLRPD